jgi:anaerobic magnesium-protoporphyrin IX monomethyl ester cyclase
VKIQLLNPMVHHYANVHYRMNPALGLPILAAVLERAGHTAEVWDLEAMGATPAGLRAAYGTQRERWPDAVGLTCTTHNRRGVGDVIASLRQIGFDRRIVVGGPHATVAPESVMELGADAVVVGECEGNVAAVFGGCERGIVAGKPMPIELIPGPMWSKHEPKPTSYYGNLPKVGHPEGIAMWSRGCPHSCIFCGNPVFGHQRIRYRPVEAIAQDMGILKTMGVKSVFVYDDELVGLGGKQNAWLTAACSAVAPLDLTWKCQGRCTTKLTRDVLEAMHRAGCRAIMWGVESFSEAVLDAIQKGTTEADIWHTLRLAKEVGIGNWLFLMVGNYQETEADLAYTEGRLEEAARGGLVQWRQVTVCTPEPGTKLWELAKAGGWLVDAPESGPQMAQAFAPTPWLTRNQIRQWKMRLEVAA